MSAKWRFSALFGLAVFVMLAASVAAPAKQRSTITLNALFDSQVTPGIQAVIANFERAYPNITVNATFEQVTQECTALVTEAAGGNAPDVFGLNLGNTLNCATYPMAAAGQLLPLGGPWVKRVPAIVRPLLERKHRIYAYPTVMTAFVFAYNKKLFSDAGVKPFTPASTFTDVLAACSKFS